MYSDPEYFLSYTAAGIEPNIIPETMFKLVPLHSEIDCLCFEFQIIGN